MHLIHLIDAARLTDDLRPLCGAPAEDPTLTTLPQVATCAACARLAALAAIDGPAPRATGRLAQGLELAGPPRG